jgi:hypothetical protein
MNVRYNSPQFTKSDKSPVKKYLPDRKKKKRDRNVPKYGQDTANAPTFLPPHHPVTTS